MEHSSHNYLESIHHFGGIQYSLFGIYYTLFNNWGVSCTIHYLGHLKNISLFGTYQIFIT